MVPRTRILFFYQCIFMSIFSASNLLQFKFQHIFQLNTVTWITESCPMFHYCPGMENVCAKFGCYQNTMMWMPLQQGGGLKVAGDPCRWFEWPRIFMVSIPTRCNYNTIIMTNDAAVSFWRNTDKNIVRHTAHTIVSWPNPKQWLMIHTSGLMMMIRSSTHSHDHHRRIG